MVSLEHFSQGFASFTLQACSFSPEGNRFLSLAVEALPPTSSLSATAGMSREAEPTQRQQQRPIQTCVITLKSEWEQLRNSFSYKWLVGPPPSVV